MNRETPQVGKELRRALFPEIRSVNEARRQITFTSSDQSVDRYGDRLMVNGWDYQAYLRNPVVLWSHKSDELPVGKCVDLKIESTPVPALVQTVEFATHDFASTVFDLYRGKFLSAVSVGFIPTSQPTPIKDENGNFSGWEFNGQTLLELSCVPVPANENALARARAAGFAEEYLQRAFGTEEVSTIPETVAGLKEKIVALKEEIATLKMPLRQEICTTESLCAAVKAASASVQEESEKSPASDETITTFEQLGATGRDVTTLDELGEALGESTIISPAGSRKWRDVR
jgi:uncharacterized protein